MHMQFDLPITPGLGPWKFIMSYNSLLVSGMVWWIRSHTQHKTQVSPEYAWQLEINFHWIGLEISCTHICIFQYIVVEPYNSAHMMTTWHENAFALLVLCEGNPTMMQSSGVFFVVGLNKSLSKQLSCWWFEMSWYSYDCNGMLSWNKTIPPCKRHLQVMKNSFKWVHSK